MNGFVHKSRASAYSRAHCALLEAREIAGRPLTREEAERRLLVTPGLMFASSVTLRDVFNTLKTCRLISLEGDQVEVLSW